MKDIFEDLSSRGELVIKEFLEQGMQESLTLDFKRKEDPSHGRIGKSDKKNLCKELSAMSNSLGGILVWGVGASTDEVGVDRVQELEPISDIDRFCSEVSNQIGQAISPVNEDIDVLLIRCAKISQRVTWPSR